MAATPVQANVGSTGPRNNPAPRRNVDEIAGRVDSAQNLNAQRRESRGHTMESHKAITKIGIGGKMKSAVSGLFQMAVPGMFSQDQFKAGSETFDEVRTGYRKSEVFSAPTKIKPKGNKYDPTSPDSMKNYFDSNKRRVMDHNGYQYLLNHDDGTILFLTPAGKIFSVRVWNVKNGASIDSETKLKAFAKAAILAWPGIEKEGEGLNHFVFDIDSGMVRGYEYVFKTVQDRIGQEWFQEVDLGTQTGKWIKAVSDETWTDIKALFDPASTENKKKLDGDKVHPQKVEREGSSSPVRRRGRSATPPIEELED